MLVQPNSTKFTCSTAQKKETKKKQQNVHNIHENFHAAVDRFNLACRAPRCRDRVGFERFWRRCIAVPAGQWVVDEGRVLQKGLSACRVHTPARTPPSGNVVYLEQDRACAIANPNTRQAKRVPQTNTRRCPQSACLQGCCVFLFNSEDAELSSD